MDALASEIPDLANDLLKHLDAGRTAEAEAQVRDLAREWREPRRRLSQGLTRLHGLKADRIAATEAT